jgi:hypothetical protein
MAAAIATLATILARSSFIHIEGTAIDFSTVEACHSFPGCLMIYHFDKSKAAGLARLSIRDYVHTLNITESSENRFQIVLVGLVGQVSYENICHLNLSTLFSAVSRMFFLAS